MNQNTYESMQPHRIEGPEAIFAWAYGLFRNNWKRLFAIAVVPVLFVYVGNLLVVINPTLIVLTVICYVIAAITGIAMIPALIKTIHAIATNSPEAPRTTGASYSAGFRSFWTVLLVIIIAVLVSFGSAVLFVIPGIIVILYMVLYIFSTVLGGKKGFASLSDSFSLVRGRWWAVLARTLFLVLVCELFYVVVILIGLIVSLLFAALGAPILTPIIVAIVAIVAVPILVSFSYAYQYRTYVLLGANPLPVAPSVRVFRGWTIAFAIIGLIAIVLAVIAIRTIVPFLLLQTQQPSGNWMPTSQMQQYYGQQSPLSQ